MGKQLWQGDAVWNQAEKAKAEVFTFTYGSLW